MSTSQSTQQTMNRLNDSQRQQATPESRHVRSHWPWLLFKEAKQLAPLFIALAACGFVLHLLGTFGQANSPMNGVSLIMVPFLFAIGASPMLVSQEKEQRSLGWIGSLPINPRSIVLSKLIVCVLGLMLSWIISIGLTWVIAPSFSWSHSNNQVDLLAWIYLTFVLLSAGFALAWFFQTAVSSLIGLLVSCCVVPYLGMLVTSLGMMVYYGAAAVGAHEFDRSGFGVWFGLVTVGVSCTAAVHFGQRSFVANAATESIFSLSRWRSRRSPQHNQPILWSQSPSSSLIWQTSRQNSLLWSGLLLIVVMAGTMFLYLRLNKPTQEDLFLAILLPAGFVLSWLGVSVFGSDAYRQRINFLAQRGVAPGLIWWTRMILPLGSVILGLVGFFLLVWLPSQYRPFYSEAAKLICPPLAIVGVLMVFAFTQWFSQWTRSTLIGFCVAPAVAAMTVGYLGFLIEFLKAPWWVLLPSIVVAMLATRIMLCPWMDARFDWRYWTSHGTLLLVALGIPLIPCFYTWATYPDMPPAMKRSLAAEVEGYQQSPRSAIIQLKSNKVGLATDDATAEPVDIASSVSDRIDAMERELSSTHGPIWMPGNKIAVRTADLLSLRIDSMMDSEESDGQEQANRQRSFQRYRRVMVLLDHLVRRMRLSEDLAVQDYADGTERWLVSEMSRPGRREIFSEQQYARIVAGLADQDARHQARRRAIVMIWNESRIEHNNQFRNMNGRSDPRDLWAPRWLVAERDAGVAAASLLKHLESSVPTPLSYPGELASFGLGSYPSPGMLWHRPWESKAKQLAESLKSTPATKGDDDE